MYHFATFLSESRQQSGSRVRLCDRLNRCQQLLRVDLDIICLVQQGLIRKFKRQFCVYVYYPRKLVSEFIQLRPFCIKSMCQIVRNMILAYKVTYICIPIEGSIQVAVSQRVHQRHSKRYYIKYHRHQPFLLYHNCTRLLTCHQVQQTCTRVSCQVAPALVIADYHVHCCLHPQGM